MSNVRRCSLAWHFTSATGTVIKILFGILSMLLIPSGPSPYFSTIASRYTTNFFLVTPFQCTTAIVGVAPAPSVAAIGAKVLGTNGADSQNTMSTF